MRILLYVGQLLNSVRFLCDDVSFIFCITRPLARLAIGWTRPRRVVPDALCRDGQTRSLVDRGEPKLRVERPAVRERNAERGTHSDHTKQEIGVLNGNVGSAPLLNNLRIPL